MAEGRSSGDEEMGYEPLLMEHEQARASQASRDSYLQGFAMPDPREGLSSEEAERRIRHFGLNELPEKEENACLEFIGFFTGPMAIMIWVACVVELIEEAWPDFAVLLLLQLVNGLVGYFEEQNAGSAIAALKASLTPKCTVRRDGRVQTMEAKRLVPGDVVLIKLGDIVPADCVLVEGTVLCDQAALTGESLPVQLHQGELVKMGTTIRRGEVVTLCQATGEHTFFGRAAGMVQEVQTQGRFQHVLFKITLVLLVVAILVSLTILISLLYKGIDLLRAVGVCVVLLVASIPIAMQVVSTSTMAVGARHLAAQKAIVARLSAIEELAGMSMLCSDKTGTLTQNKLSLFDPILIEASCKEDLLFYAALAARRMEDGQDAIDHCITQELARYPALVERLSQYEELSFVPFDPSSKRTEAVLRLDDGQIIKVTKGAPQVILNLCRASPEVESQVRQAIQSLADRGYRALGVAVMVQPPPEPQEDRQLPPHGLLALRCLSPSYCFLGLLSLFDPPRHDTRDTIQRALHLGIEVKMVTGDQTAIAKETCRALGMGVNVLDADVFINHRTALNLADCVRDAHGFAEVMPENKYAIVTELQNQGLTVGMTGDGVNDAPALKKAHIGIAVQGATDAARAAADIVLCDPGLSVIIDAVITARKIFARVRNYCIYRIACTLQLIFFFFIAVLAFEPADNFPTSQRERAGDKTLVGSEKSSVQGAFYLPVLTLVLLTILNDGCILTIVKDRVVPSPRPEHWNLPEIFAVSAALGAHLVVINVGMLAMGLSVGPGANPGARCGQNPADFDFSVLVNTDKCTGFLPSVLGSSEYGTISYAELRGIVYLCLSLSGFLTIFAARTRGSCWSRAPGHLLSLASVLALLITTLVAAKAGTWSDAFGIGAVRSGSLGFVWAYVAVSFLIQDLAVKRAVYWAVDQLNGPEDQHSFWQRQRRATIGTVIQTEEKWAIRAERDSLLRASTSSGLSSNVISTPSGLSSTSSPQHQLLESRLAHLERYTMDLEALVKAMSTQLQVLTGTAFPTVGVSGKGLLPSSSSADDVRKAGRSSRASTISTTSINSSATGSSTATYTEGDKTDEGSWPQPRLSEEEEVDGPMVGGR